MEGLSPLFLVLLLGCINWFATALGGAVVLVNSNKLDKLGYTNILALSAGIMLSATFWSLLLPSVEMSKEYNQNSTFVACLGFGLGVLFLRFISKYSSLLFKKSTSKQNNGSLLITAISIHNIPEGFIIGVLVSGLSQQVENLDLISVVTLSLSIGLQNIPEGLAVAFPIYSSGKTRLQSFNTAQLTGLIEPVSALLGYLFVSEFPSVLPYSLAFAGGSMVYVIIDELIPEFSNSNDNNSKNTILWFSIGFIIMMALDTFLS